MKTYRLLYLLLLFASLESWAQTDTLLVAAPIASGMKAPNNPMADRLGNIWLGSGFWGSTNGTGAFRFDMISWTRFDSSNGMPSNNVYKILEESSGKLWFGTSAGLASLNNGSWAYINRSNSQLKCDTILSLAHRNNVLHIGTANGLFLYSGGNFTRYDSNNWGLSSNIVTAVCASADGSVWIGTPKGVARLKNGTWTSYHKNNSAFNGGYVFDIKEDKHGHVWFSAGKLFVAINGVMQSASAWQPCYSRELNINAGRQMAFDDQGNLLVGLSGTSYDPCMLKIENNSVTLFYGYGTMYSICYSKGYLWRNPGGFPLQRFNYSAYKELLPSKNPGWEIADSTYAFLDINKVKAVMQNKGDMFDRFQDRHLYEDRDFPCRNMFFKSALWMSGRQDSNLKVAAMMYRDGLDFTSGPLDTVTGTIGTWRDFNRIWKLNRSTIETFRAKYADGSVENGTYKIPGEILTWPAQGPGKFSRNLAPFHDNNADGLYDPYAGDYPVIKGDQMLYWIFNDNTYHTQSGGERFVVEIHASAYAYNCDTIDPGSARSALNRTTFYEYRIINRSMNSYSDVKLGVWADFDIGNYGDDYVGCNPRLHTAFAYNGDSLDDGINGFGTEPPIANIILLSDSLNSFMAYGTAGTSPDPNYSLHYDFNMSSRLSNGNHLKYGGTSGIYDARFAYPGNDDPDFPLQEWTEKSSGNLPGDRRAVMGTAPFTLSAGSQKVFTYAIMHTPSAFIPKDEQKNEDRIIAIRNYYKTQNFPSCITSATTSTGKSKTTNETLNVYPNPGHSHFTFEFESTRPEKISLKLYDMTGREVAVLHDGQVTAGKQSITADLSHLPPGIYIYTLQRNNAVVSEKLIIQR